MSTAPIPSALDARTQAFPTLTAAQINRIRPDGKLRRVQVGEILFEPGDTNVPFFVLLSGIEPARSSRKPHARRSQRVKTQHHVNGIVSMQTTCSGHHVLIPGL